MKVKLVSIIAVIGLVPDILCRQRYSYETSIKSRLSGRVIEYIWEKKEYFHYICTKLVDILLSFCSICDNFTMVKHCIAFGCTNREEKEHCKGLSWHSLPLANKKLLDLWLVKIHRTNTPVTKHSVLCSKHFEPECFIKPLGGQRIRLKPGSVPTKFIFTVEKPARKMPDRNRGALATTTKSKKKSTKKENVNSNRNSSD